jgi:hypothetical protein
VRGPLLVLISHRLAVYFDRISGNQSLGFAAALRKAGFHEHL